MLVVVKSELRACYVVPEAARQGVGTAIVREIERLVGDSGLRGLELNASIKAEPFYAALGYDSVERGEHVLRSGVRMAVVKMAKRLGEPDLAESGPAPPLRATRGVVSRGGIEPPTRRLRVCCSAN